MPNKESRSVEFGEAQACRAMLDGQVPIHSNPASADTPINSGTSTPLSFYAPSFLVCRKLQFLLITLSDLDVASWLW